MRLSEVGSPYNDDPPPIPDSALYELWESQPMPYEYGE